MRVTIPGAISIAPILIALTTYGQLRHPVSAPEQSAPEPVTFRIVFGYQRTAPKIYDGRLRVTGGVLRGMEPWRFLQGDALTGADAWKLQIRRITFASEPDAPSAMAGGGFPLNIVPAGIFVTVDSTANSVAFETKQGNFSVRLADLQYGRDLWFLDGDVQVERVPAAVRSSPKNSEEHDFPSIAVTRTGELWTAWQAYQDRGDNVYVRRQGAEPVRLTSAKGDIFRTSIAEDPEGRIHVVWSERLGEAWNLYERIFDGHDWSSRAQITRGRAPNIYHKLVAGRAALDLVWVGHEGGQSYLYLSSYSRSGGWSEPSRIGGPSVWSPDAAFDNEGNLHAAWDSYQAGNYDIFYRRIAADGTPAPIEQITKGPSFEAHPSLAVDGQGRPWLAFDRSGANWGKDWSHEDQNRSTVLYKDRSILVLVKDQGVWKEGPDLAAAVPDRLRRYWQLPHLAADGTGRIWALFQIRTSAVLQRIDYWSAAACWDLYLATIDHGVWQMAAIVPNSAGRNEAPFQIAAAAHSVHMTWATDGRDPGKSAASYQAGTMVHYDIFSAQASAPSPSGVPELTTYREAGTPPQIMHPHERDDVSRIRDYRLHVGANSYRILRGDFHRHTDISNDGAGDGSLEDYYRYMLDAAAMDTGIVTDHNMGGDIEYNWWRTEKFYDLFVIPGRFTPLFGYERSVNYPNGHRNVVFDHRGVRTLPVGAEENSAKVDSGSILYPYLRQNRGICMEHSLATGQGTDWRDNDQELEPLVEIYQGYHAAYEAEGAPRAENGGNHLLVHGAYEPAGFFWNALNKGYKLGVQASSDHISTHVSYAMILTPDVSRSAIVDNMRQRHAYAATDNIIVDFQAVDTDGSAHLMGDIVTGSRSLRLRVRVQGTDTLTRLELVRNAAVIYNISGDGKKDAAFEFRDTAPLEGTNWYYLRVTQMDRNLAWSSPIWVTYR